MRTLSHPTRLLGLCALLAGLPACSRTIVDLSNADLNIPPDLSDVTYSDFPPMPLLDRSGGIPLPDNAAALYAIIGSSYVANFASTAGVSLKSQQGMPIKIGDAIIHHGDTTEVKQLESFLGFLKNAPGGTLPDLYDAKSANAAKRLVCTKGC